MYYLSKDSTKSLFFHKLLIVLRKKDFFLKPVFWFNKEPSKTLDFWLIANETGILFPRLFFLKKGEEFFFSLLSQSNFSFLLFGGVLSFFFSCPFLKTKNGMKKMWLPKENKNFFVIFVISLFPKFPSFRFCSVKILKYSQIFSENLRILIIIFTLLKWRRVENK